MNETRSTQAEQAKVLYESGFVDIVLPDGSVLSLKVDETVPLAWRFPTISAHCELMGQDDQATYFTKQQLPWED